MTPPTNTDLSGWGEAPLAIPRTKPSSSDHKRMVSLVDKVAVAAAAMRDATTPTEQDVCAARIRGLELGIDDIVYQSFGLSSAEIAAVESAS